MENEFLNLKLYFVGIKKIESLYNNYYKLLYKTIQYIIDNTHNEYYNFRRI